MVTDVRHALRMLWRNRTHTGPAILALGLATGAFVCIATLAYTHLARPLPFPHADSLVRIYGEANGGETTQLSLSKPRYEFFRSAQQTLSGIAASSYTALTLTGEDEAVQLPVSRTTSSYLDVLGVTPIAGRNIRPEEDVPGAPGVVLLARPFWRQHFHDAPVIGRPMTLSGANYEIIGVLPDLPPGELDGIDLIVNRPFDLGYGDDLMARGISFLRVTGRLKPGLTLEAAQTEFRALTERYRANAGARADATWTTTVVDLRADLARAARTPALLLLGGVFLLQAIACANVGNLMLASFIRRRREVAVRSALGASTWAVVRLFVSETVLLSAVAGVLGVAMAGELLPLLPSIDGSGLPLLVDASTWWTMIACAALVSLLSAIAIGGYPAVVLARERVAALIRESGRGTVGSGALQAIRSTLVGVQVAISFGLVVGALLLAATIRQLLLQPVGFDPSGVTTAAIALPLSRYPDVAMRNQFWRRLQAALAEAPGVRSAAIASGVPLTNFDSRGPYARADMGDVPLNERPLGLTRSASAGYLATIGVPLLEGRDFRDVEDHAVTIISRGTARRLFPEGHAVGHYLLLGSVGGGQRAEIIGVAADTRSMSLARVNDVELYRPIADRSFPGMQVVVKMSGDGDAGRIIRDVTRRLDPDLPVIGVETLEAALNGSTGSQRLLLSVLGVFALLSSAFAALGVYSVVSYVTAERTNEIGIRMALGSARSAIVSLTVLDALRPVAMGLVGGTLLSAIIGQTLRAVLFGVSPVEPATLLAAAVALAAIALAATAIPAVRASRIDPLDALRRD